MREILFRGEAVGSGMWVCGQYRKTAKLDLIYPFDDRADCLAVYPETVGQFTGLTDKNGKKIFEGDIVAWCGSVGAVCYGEFNCSCCDGVYGWYFSNTADIRDSDYYEVIGNIHDNPELLED